MTRDRTGDHFSDIEEARQMAARAVDLTDEGYGVAVRIGRRSEARLAAE